MALQKAAEQQAAKADRSAEAPVDSAQQQQQPEGQEGESTEAAEPATTASNTPAQVPHATALAPSEQGAL